MPPSIEKLVLGRITSSPRQTYGHAIRDLAVVCAPMSGSGEYGDRGHERAYGGTLETMIMKYAGIVFPGMPFSEDEAAAVAKELFDRFGKHRRS